MLYLLDQTARFSPWAVWSQLVTFNSSLSSLINFLNLIQVLIVTFQQAIKVHYFHRLIALTCLSLMIIHVLITNSFACLVKTLIAHLLKILRFSFIHLFLGSLKHISSWLPSFFPSIDLTVFRVFNFPFKVYTPSSKDHRLAPHAERFLSFQTQVCLCLVWAEFLDLVVLLLLTRLKDLYFEIQVLQSLMKVCLNNWSQDL